MNNIGDLTNRIKKWGMYFFICFMSLLMIALSTIVVFEDIRDKPQLEKSREDCPLDAVVYSTPNFINGDARTLKVVDRQNHCAWWVIYYNNEYIVLPIGKILTGDE